MKKVIGYLVKDNKGEVIGATGSEIEARYIAKKENGIVFKVVTTLILHEDPTTEQTIICDWTTKRV